MALDKTHKLPIYKKAMEIFGLTKAIVESIDEENDRVGIRNILMEHAIMLGAKIANAEGSGKGTYSRQMEMAVLVKYNACELKVQSNWLTMNKMTDQKYVQLLRDEIDAFKPLFVEWIKTFDPTDDYNDGWLYITPPIKDDEADSKDYNDGEGFNLDDFDFHEDDTE